MRLQLYFYRKTATYYARVQINGKRQRHWLGPNRVAAKKQLKTLFRQIEDGHFMGEMVLSSTRLDPAGRKDVRLEELIHRHLSWVQAQRSAGTYELRRSYLLQLLDFCQFGRIPTKVERDQLPTKAVMVSDVTREILDGFHSYIRQGLPTHPNAGNEHLAHIKAMLRWADEVELCDSFIKRFPRLRRMPALTKRLKSQEIAGVLLALPQDLQDLVKFGLLTGLRPQELRGLTRTHLAPQSDGSLQVVIERHKTSMSAHSPVPRSVTLSNEAQEIVERQIASHPKSEYVFVNSDGGPYTAHVLRRRLKRACKRNKIPQITPYALRHSFASMLAESGVNQISLSQLMGHTSARTTARYVSGSDEFQQEVMQRQSAQISKIIAEALDQGTRKVATKVATQQKTA